MNKSKDRYKNLDKSKEKSNDKSKEKLLIDVGKSVTPNKNIFTKEGYTKLSFRLWK